MANKVLSIEIGMNTTRICMADFKKKNAKVYSYAKFPTPEGTFADGEIQTTEPLIKALSTVLAEHHMNCKHVVFTISSSKIASREIVIPKVKEKKIPALIQVNAGDYFPIDLSQYELGHVIMGLTKDEEAPKYKVLVFAVPHSLIASYRRLAAAIGKQMIGFDYSGHSIYQMVKGECKTGVQMVVKVDEEASIVTVLKDQAIVLQRTVAYGINDAINTIMSCNAFEAPSYEEALDLSTRKTCIKLWLDASKAVPEEGEEEEDAALLAAKQAVANSLRMLLNGIGRIMDYHSSRNAGEVIENIYITGMGADFSGLSKLMTNELGIKTKGLKNIEGFNVEKSFKDGRFGEYIACMGATIAPLGMVSERKDNAKAGAGGSNVGMLLLSFLVFLCGVGAAAVMYYTTTATYDELKHNNNLLNNRINELKPAEEVYNRYLAVQSQRDRVYYLYATTETPNENLVAFINELEDILPDTFYTTGFTSDKNGISLSVTVEGKESAALTIRNIRNMESIQDISISGISDAKDDFGVSTVSFSLTATYSDLNQAEEE